MVENSTVEAPTSKGRPSLRNTLVCLGGAFFITLGAFHGVANAAGTGFGPVAPPTGTACVDGGIVQVGSKYAGAQTEDWVSFVVTECTEYEGDYYQGSYLQEVQKHSARWPWRTQ